MLRASLLSTLQWACISRAAGLSHSTESLPFIRRLNRYILRPSLFTDSLPNRGSRAAVYLSSTENSLGILGLNKMLRASLLSILQWALDRFLWEQKVAKKVKVFWQLLVRNFGQ